MWRDNKQGGRLTKLRYYCSLCQHNCIDEHGFALHLASEKHLANEEHAAGKRAASSAPKYFYDDRSAKFERAYLECLVSRHLDQAVAAHDVYHETFEKDRPMNELKATCWDSLGAFITNLRDRGRLDEATRAAEGWVVSMHAASCGADGNSLPGTELPKRVGAAPKKWDEAGASTCGAAPRARRAAETDWALRAAETASREEATPAVAPTERTDFETKVGFGVAPSKRQKPLPCSWPVEQVAAEDRAGAAAGAAAAYDGWASPGCIVKVLRGPSPHVITSVTTSVTISSRCCTARAPAGAAERGWSCGRGCEAAAARPGWRRWTSQTSERGPRWPTWRPSSHRCVLHVSPLYLPYSPLYLPSDLPLDLLETPRRWVGPCGCCRASTEASRRRCEGSTRPTSVLMSSLARAARC